MLGKTGGKIILRIIEKPLKVNTIIGHNAKFSNNTNLGSAVDSLTGSKALQRDLNKLERGNHQLYEV